MTYEELRRANESIITTDVKGKAYAEVNQRIKAFRMVYPNGGIVTDMLSNDGEVCVFRATVYDEQQHVIGTGTAYEKEGSSYINKTSYIENCETSAVGRALGMCGFGIDTAVCSAEEVQNAILQQSKAPDIGGWAVNDPEPCVGCGQLVAAEYAAETKKRLNKVVCPACIAEAKKKKAAKNEKAETAS